MNINLNVINGVIMVIIGFTLGYFWMEDTLHPPRKPLLRGWGNVLFFLTAAVLIILGFVMIF